MTLTRTENDGLTLILERDIDAPRGTVWRCWTEEDLFKQWYCPKPWTVPKADFNLRPGGRMNCVMQGPDGERIELFGIWLEIIAGESLTFTDAYTEDFLPQPDPFMTGFVRLSDTDSGGTSMIWGARHSSREDVQKHLEMGFKDGWTAASGQLEELAQTLGSG